MQIHAIDGIRIGTAQAGIKRAGRDDLTLFELAAGSASAAVFTRNAFAAAPVLLARRHLAEGTGRYWLINSGNANAGTGAAGESAARETCAAVAALTGTAPQDTLPFSTGVIGEPLPAGKITAALPAAVAALDAQNWERAAAAIMTTDTRPKLASERIELGGRAVHITGIAKGAGMICPNMATMLAFVGTDASIEPRLLRNLLAQAADESFNCITVDGDTSTNDACVVAATGRAGNAPVAAGEDARVFGAALTRVCTALAHAIVQDGEGATKFVTIAVRGGASVAECRAIGYTVAHSPLVKTALFASDPNWGRILAAVGRAGLADLDIGRVAIDVEGIPIVRDGGRIAGYDEAPVARAMRGPRFTIGIELGRGTTSANLWTCDLSYDYVKINAEYRS
ncbi:MAG: bifunctional glutamate N-acetyltransferase/amino-acid acetyltransferase ArgJ [Gammaproteobacteria bacterium]